MPDQESKKEEKDRPVVQSSHKDANLDIENALSFLDSEDDEKEVSPKRDSRPSATSEPLTPEIKADKPIRKEEKSPAKSLEKEVRHSLEDAERISQKRALEPAEGNKNTKIWILLSGVVVLMILVALAFL